MKYIPRLLILFLPFILFSTSVAQSGDVECFSRTSTEVSSENDLAENFMAVFVNAPTSFIQNLQPNNITGRTVQIFLQANPSAFTAILTSRRIENGEIVLEASIFDEITDHDIIILTEVIGEILTAEAIELFVKRVIVQMAVAAGITVGTVATASIVAVVGIVAYVFEFNVLELAADSLECARLLWKDTETFVSEYSDVVEVWLHDYFSGNEVRLNVNTGTVEVTVSGQTLTFNNNVLVSQITDAIGINESEFLEVNIHLAYQSSPDGDILDYRANVGLSATLPGGNAMDVGELILRVQLGIPIIDEADPVPDATNMLEAMHILSAGCCQSRDIAFSPDGRLLAVPDDYGVVSIWNITTEEIEYTVDTSVQRVVSQINSLDFSPDGMTLAIGSNSWVKLWDMNTQQFSGEIPSYSRSVGFSNNGTWLARATADTIELWNLDTFEVRTLLDTRDSTYPFSEIRQMTVSLNGELIASAIYDNYAPILNINTGEIIAVFNHPIVIEAVALSPDNTILATGGGDATVTESSVVLWDIASRQGISSFSRKNERVFSLDFSPDGRFVVAAGGGIPTINLTRSRTGSVILWDVANREMVSVRHVDAPIESVAFSPDGTLLAFRIRGGNIEIWSLSDFITLPDADPNILQYPDLSITPTPLPTATPIPILPLDCTGTINNTSKIFSDALANTPQSGAAHNLRELVLIPGDSVRVIAQTEDEVMVQVVYERWDGGEGWIERQDVSLDCPSSETTSNESPRNPISEISVEPGQIWQGEASEYDYGNYIMTLRIIEVGTDSFVANMDWPSFGNTITSVDGEYISDISKYGEQERWSFVDGGGSLSEGIRLRFTETNFIQGRGVQLNCIYYAILRSDRIMSGVWFCQGSSRPDGEFQLNLESFPQMTLTPEVTTSAPTTNDNLLVYPQFFGVTVTQAARLTGRA